MVRSLVIFFLALSLASGLVLAIYQSARASQTGQVTKKSKPTQKAVKAQDTEKKVAPTLARFMRKKLSASNSVLKGLMTDDFKEIEEGADALMKMSLTEQWRVSNDPAYARYSLDYQNTVRKLKAKAKKGTVDGSALAWVDVTMSCIECHEWVRDVLYAENDRVVTPNLFAKAGLEDWIASHDFD